MVQKLENTREKFIEDEKTPPSVSNNAAILKLTLLYFQLSLLGTILQIYKTAGLLGQVREAPW